MKKFVTYDSIPIYLVKDGNASFGINFTTRDNRVLDSQDLFFEPSYVEKWRKSGAFNEGKGFV